MEQAKRTPRDNGGPLGWLFSLADAHPGLALGLSLVTALFIGAGAYLFGNSTGADLSQAEQQGRTAGMAKGAEAGGARGYQAGFAEAKRRSYVGAYERSYRRGYARAYEQAGLNRPQLTSIEVP